MSELDEIPISLYKTENNEFIKYVRYDDYKKLQNIIKEVREAVETGISEDNYDGCIYDIKNILDKGE